MYQQGRARYWVSLILGQQKCATEYMSDAEKLEHLEGEQL